MAHVPESTGSWVAVITPFQEDGAVDFPGFRRLVDFHVANGTDMLLVTGSAGEGTLLSFDERKEIYRELAPYCKNQIPLFAGVTCPTTRETVRLAQAAEAAGVTGVVVTVPAYLLPPQSAVLQYLKEVARSVSCEVAIYNNPSRVRVNIEPQTFATLFHEFPNVSINKDASPRSSQLAEIMRLTNHRARAFCCDNPDYGLILSTLAMGGRGTANITGNIIPAEMHELSQPWDSMADVVRSRDLLFKHLRLMQLMYRLVNPIMVKAALELLDLPSGAPRPPLQSPPAELVEELRDAMAESGVLDRYRGWTSRGASARA
ncbi:MAG TPA: dihydrodipicolinate synthase family protein [bacterium]|nr:dihydrodipicolinate synthase family protein [bacterium]